MSKAKKPHQATALEQMRWPSLTCNGCCAETRANEIDVARLRQTMRHKGWVVNRPSGHDYCPVCVKMGLHEDQAYNQPKTHPGAP